MTSDAKGPTHRTPPYIAFKTFLNLLGDFKTHGLPPVVDRSVLTRFAGGLQGQILLALRSLGLMGDNDRPTRKLATLVEAHDTPAFKAELRKVIEDTYPYVLALDLANATPGMFANAFKDNLDAKEDVLRKCRTFFLNAAREVGVPIGPRIAKAKFPRSRPNGARAVKARMLPPPPSPGPSPLPGEMSDKAMEYQLVDLMKEPDIDAAERDAIWTLIQYLARKNKAADR